jgi:hypothetical protein
LPVHALEKKGSSNMNTKATLFGFTMAGAVALVVSCSGSTDSGNASGGSSSGGSATAGKGGTSSAGTSNNSSGSSSGGKSSGGTGSNTGGTRPMGGNNNGGFTFGGNFNFGGDGPDPSDFICDPVPVPDSACGPGAQPCADGTTFCYCSMSKWVCMDVGGTGGAGPDFGQIECPATKPMSGTDCGDVNGGCPYGQNSGCACYNGKWACL